MLYFILAAALTALDQLVKFLVPPPGQPSVSGASWGTSGLGSSLSQKNQA